MIGQKAKSAWVYTISPVYMSVASLIGRDKISHHEVTLDLGFDCIHPAIAYRLSRGLMAYEESERQFIDKYLEADSNVLELGAGMGFISCYANQRLDAETTHIAVEANERLIPVLEHNRELNQCSYDIVHAAYSPSERPLEFNLNRNFYSSSEYHKEKTEGVVEVPGVSLETLIADHELEEFTLICDIEGSEGRLLQSEQKALESHCQQLIIEVHDNDGGRIAKQRLVDSDFTKVDEDPNGEVYVYE